MPLRNRCAAAFAAALLALALHTPAVARTGDGAGVKPAARDEAKPEKRRNTCAFRRNIRNFRVINDRYVVLESGRRDFLVTLSGGCLDLDFEFRLAIQGRPVSGICLERGDRVISDEFHSCVIRKIEAVENMDEARKLVAERREAALERKKERKERGR